MIIKAPENNHLSRCLKPKEKECSRARRNKDKKEERKNDEMNKNERDGSGVRRERAEWPKRRKVNIVRDGIRRNYCCIKIYRILEVRLAKLTSSCTHTSFMAFQYPTHRSELPRS